MALRVSVDTTFLIDLQRERSTGDDDGAAHRFLKRSPDAELYLSTIALGEFAEGFDGEQHPILNTMRDGHVLVPVDDQIAFTYARIVRELRRRGELIGTNDLWIGCTSLRLGIPIVTANVADFRCIDGLGIVQYR
ncbi:type II toxin-antitoxin system VapC family toxin [Mycobacterium pseudokansasii]|uniref:Ribonuclease VapC1 n=1 Tax=Mycobacterium pseudokansasii TaxID=2341080 RepID=A0A498R0C4_9MYCO|nr:type II toxin-antitoxin system VapC family toxin [Mycobacterium pseudokansasii]EUA11385.1 PIN domain protein [Mycobacterium kansasii 732]KZS64036.1 PIN domain-containing protein [Mycobacterium kansasii]VBA30356.1 Ribonuclease VapC1 [Mycobacterium pseudokansasii]VBA32076.1 Ribonuclease VapC1 [Mycobacterium pseudokansasii]VBA54364.1 Ribonuclease VapC1 [Mycobacterium pseudokansasii]